MIIMKFGSDKMVNGHQTHSVHTVLILSSTEQRQLTFLSSTILLQMKFSTWRFN